MKSIKQKILSVLGLFALVTVTFAFAPTAHANVYATSLTINGDATNAVNSPQGSPVTISYILNEPATAGVAINILSGETVVRAISVASGEGTNKGTNSVVWDGKATGGANVDVGSYSVSVTAAAIGYQNWTQISDDSAPSSYTFRPRSIAVNNNANSPYYGRIFIGNVASNGTSTAWGDVTGIYKVNADGSYSDDGAGRFGTAGYIFEGPGYYDAFDNPLNMKVKEDDRLYWNNWVNNGEVVASDMLLTTNQVVMPWQGYSANPYPSGQWKTFEVTDILTDHARLYLCDAGFPSGGVWWWPMTNGIADLSDVSDFGVGAGHHAVATGGSLSLRCDGVAIDANTNVYVMQTRSNVGDPSMRAASWTNWDGQTTLSTDAAWVVGSAGDTIRNNFNMSLDSVDDPHYIAIGMSSVPPGGITILNAADGSIVVSNLSASATYHGVNWDNVGNLYGGSQSASRWRVFSPPGANQATTVALATVQVTGGITPILIGQISVDGGNVTIHFTSDASDTASSFTLQRAATVDGIYGDVSAAITQTGSGAFQAVVPTTGSASFYQIRK